MKKKEWIILLILVIIAFTLEITIMQIYSYKGGNKDIVLNPISYINAKYEDGKYITTEDNSEFEFEYDGFINEFAYIYESENDFSWEITVNEKENKKYVSASIINIADKRVRLDANKIKININGKGIIINDFKVHNRIDFNVLRFILISVTLLIIAYIIFNKNDIEKKLPKIFLITIITLGTLLILSTPLSAYTSEDDQVHFHNMYTLLDGKETQWSRSARYYDKLLINAPFRFVTSEEQKAYISFLNNNDNSDTNIIRENQDYGNIKYNNLVYLPEALIMKIGKTLNLPFIIVLLSAKFTNLLVYILFTYLAIKEVKKLKRLFFVVALIPHAINLACQFSYDPSLISVGMYGMAMFINMLYSEKVDKKTLYKFYISIIWICLPKAIYCPLLLLPSIINRKKYDKKEYRFVLIISVLLFVLLLSTFVLPTILSSNVAGDARVENTSVTGQLKNILQNPINYLIILIKYTITNLFPFFFGGETLNNMGYLLKTDTIVTFFMYSILLINLFHTIFTEKIDEKKYNYKTSIFIGCILVIIWGLVATALYLSWTSVGSQEIRGVQGRYFFPLSILAFSLLIPKVKEKNIYNYSNIFNYLISVVALSYNIFYILCLFNW